MTETTAQGNDFPRLGLNTEALTEEVERLLGLARKHGDSMGAVNWGDLGVVDVEYRLSMLRPEDGPHCMVRIEEASPDCYLPRFLLEHWDAGKFPNVYFECEW
jgi:hypothetical protein